MRSPSCGWSYSGAAPYAPRRSIPKSIGSSSQLAPRHVLCAHRPKRGNVGAAGRLKCPFPISCSYRDLPPLPPRRRGRPPRGPRWRPGSGQGQRASCRRSCTRRARSRRRWPSGPGMTSCRTRPGRGPEGPGERPRSATTSPTTVGHDSPASGSAARTAQCAQRMTPSRSPHALTSRSATRRSGTGGRRRGDRHAARMAACSVGRRTRLRLTGRLRQGSRTTGRRGRAVGRHAGRGRRRSRTGRRGRGSGRGG